MSTPRNYITNNWSAAERMAVVFIITDNIRTDINLGTYGAPGTPNIQSIHEFMAATREELERYIKDINKMIYDYESAHGEWFDGLVKHYNSIL